MKTSSQPTENHLAVVSMILGIISLTGAGPITGIPAIITGIIGLKNPVNKGYSWAGIITGAVSTLITLLLIGLFILFIVFASSLPSGAPSNSGNSPFPDSSQYNQQRT